MVIETFLIISVTAFYFAVMAWCTWADPFMVDFKLITQNIEWVCTVCFLNMCKFGTIVGLKYLRLISKVKDGTFQKINS